MKKKKNKRDLTLLLLPLLLLALTIPFVLNNRQTIHQQAATPTGMRTVPDPLYGVTVDSVDNLSGIVASLSHFTHKPTTRIIFDEGQQPSDYTQAVSQIQPVSYTMGMIADSTAIGSYSSTQYAQRQTDYLNAFGNQIDIWEVGNEINGEWLGSDVPAKMIAAYNVVKNAGKRTALTLYYNGLDDTNNCYENKNNLMFRWAQANVPDTMKQGLDYVFISFYEQDCSGVSKDWTKVFTQLHQMFPNAKIGFGENGTTKSSDAQSLKLQYMHEYYPAWVNVPCYTAGHFWWYYAEDYSNTTLWNALNTDMNALVPQVNGCGTTTAPPPSPTDITPTLYCLGACPSTQPRSEQQPSEMPPSAPTTPPQQPHGNNQSLIQLLLGFLMQLISFFINLFRHA